MEEVVGKDSIINVEVLGDGVFNIISEKPIIVNGLVENCITEEAVGLPITTSSC